MVGDEIHEDFQVVLFGAGEQRLKLFDALGGIHGVVGTNVEIIADRIWTAGDALQEVGVVGGKPEGRVVAGGGLTEDAGHPNSVEAELFEGSQGPVVEIGKLAAAVLLIRPVGDPVGVGVAKKAGKHLVDPQLAGAARHQRGNGGIFRSDRRQREGKIMGEIAVVFPGKEVGIRGVHHPPPARVGGHVLEGRGQTDHPVGSGPGSRDLQLQGTVLVCREVHPRRIFGFRSQAESVELPQSHLGFRTRPHQEDMIRLEGKKESGAGPVLAEGDQTGAIRPRGSGDNQEGFGGIGQVPKAEQDGIRIRSCRHFDGQDGPRRRDKENEKKEKPRHREKIKKIPKAGKPNRPISAGWFG